MKAIRKYFKRLPILLGMLLLNGLLIALLAIPPVQPAQAAPKKTKTPTPTQTPRPVTATPTPAGPICWSVVPAPAVPGYGARLLSIAGTSDNDIWAVGWFLENNSRHNLTLHWNGSTWERVPVPDVAIGRTNALNGVAAIAPNDVWAVGYAVDLSYQTVTMHWNGSAWQVVPSPNLTTPGSYNALNAVVAISSNDVWAVGGAPFGLGVYGRALLMHWDGSAWQLFPEPPEVVNWFTTNRFGVAARASNDVWAVGEFAAWHWDGSTWSVPSGFSGYNMFGASANGSTLWTAGTNPGQATTHSYIPASPNAQFLNGTTWQTTSPVSIPPLILASIRSKSSRRQTSGPSVLSTSSFSRRDGMARSGQGWRPPMGIPTRPRTRPSAIASTPSMELPPVCGQWALLMMPRERSAS